MAFDADPLWWPPAARLHATLASAAAADAASSSSSKNGNVDVDASSSSSPSSSAAAERLSATLKEYEQWLIAGLHTFKRRGGGQSPSSSSSSRAALLTGAPLSLGGGAKKIAVDGRLVQAALELAVVAVSRRSRAQCRRHRRVGAIDGRESAREELEQSKRAID